MVVPGGEGALRLDAEQLLQLGKCAPLVVGCVGKADVATVALVAQLGRLVELARLLRLPGQAPRDAAAVALAREEARLLPLAAAALRGPDRPAGRLVFERLYELAPFVSYRASNLGLCLRQIGDLDAARRVYQSGLERAPADLELWNDYGLFLRAAGQREQALAAFG